MRINTLFVIMKVAERCNLNCSYCYYYTPENAEVYERPSLMKPAVMEQLLLFVEQGATQLKIDRVVFAFHGGEPTLAKAAVMRDFCTKAKNRLAEKTIVSFAVQTNGVFLSQAWRQLMVDERMNVGISIDGEKATHDAFRVDHRGQGSYDRIRKTLKELDHSKVNLSVLSVMGPRFDGLKSYLHLVKEIGINQLKLLFPDYTRDSQPLDDDALAAFGHSLCQLFDYWLINDQDTVRIALFDDIVRRHILQAQKASQADAPVSIGVSILSDGEVRLSDDFMTPSDWYARQQCFNISNSSLADWLGQSHMGELDRARVNLPGACRACPHQYVCGGGDLPNRYSAANGFDNPSAYCVTLKILHDHIALRLADGFDEVARICA